MCSPPVDWTIELSYLTLSTLLYRLYMFHLLSNEQSRFRQNRETLWCVASPPRARPSARWPGRWSRWSWCCTRCRRKSCNVPPKLLLLTKKWYVITYYWRDTNAQKLQRSAKAPVVNKVIICYYSLLKRYLFTKVAMFSKTSCCKQSNWHCTLIIIILL
jgi:hypothetical protein